MDSEVMDKLIQLGRMQAQVDHLRMELAAAHARMDELLEMTYDRVSTDAVDRHELKQARGTADALRGMLDSSKEANHTLRARVERLSEANESMRGVIEEKNRQIAQMGQRMDTLHAELHNTHGQASLIEDANAQLVQKLADMRKENDRLKEEMRETATPVRVPVTAMGGVESGAPGNGSAHGDGAAP
jgi:chromosome segregation ATPase